MSTVEERRQARIAANLKRDQDIAARKEAKKIGNGHRRKRATHIKLISPKHAFSKMQEISTRGQILAYLRANYKVGKIYPIDDIEKQCEALLGGVDIRVYLFKMEEMNHLDLITQEE